MKKLRCGIVGFGFIGPHHAEAMRRLGFVDLVAIASKEPDSARAKADRYGIDKIYDNYEELVADPEVDVVDVATPTYLHHPVAMAAIAAGKHVIVDKPLALSAEQAREMTQTARAAGVVNAVTFNYRYNAMMQQARVMIGRGELGDIRVLHGHYMQEWLLYNTDFSWRLDPVQSGAAAMVADAGCHWFDLAEHVSGLRVQRVFANLQTMIKMRKRPAGGSREAFAAAKDEPAEEFTVEVPDYGAVLLQFDNGAAGTFFTSSLCAGHKNDLRLELNGSRASLSWGQEDPERLWVGRRDAPDQTIVRDPSLLDESVRRYAALPGGHGEAWPDAFRNTLGNIFGFIQSGKSPNEADGVLFPTFRSGYRAALIADAIVASHAAGRWADVGAEALATPAA